MQRFRNKYSTESREIKLYPSALLPERGCKRFNNYAIIFFMSDDETEKTIESEIGRLNLLIFGFVYYWNHRNKDVIDEHMNTLFHQYDVVSLYQVQGVEKETIRVMLQGLFEKMKEVALHSGIPENEIDDEKLNGYCQMAEAEDWEWSHELKKEREVDEIPQPPFKPKIH